MKKFIRVRVELIDAKGGPEDPAVEECNSYFFYPGSSIFGNVVHLAKHIARLKKKLEKDNDSREDNSLL